MENHIEESSVQMTHALRSVVSSCSGDEEDELYSDPVDLFPVAVSDTRLENLIEKFSMLYSDPVDFFSGPNCRRFVFLGGGG